MNYPAASYGELTRMRLKEERVSSYWGQVPESHVLRDSLRENVQRFVENYSWEKRKQEYFDLVDSLTKKCLI